METQYVERKCDACGKTERCERDVFGVTMIGEWIRIGIVAKGGNGQFDACSPDCLDALYNKVKKELTCRQIDGE